MKKLLIVLFITVVTVSASGQDFTYEYECKDAFGSTYDARLLKLIIHKNKDGISELINAHWFIANYDKSSEKYDIEGPFVLNIDQTEKGLMPLMGYRVYIQDWTHAFMHPIPNKNNRYQNWGEIYFPTKFITENLRIGWLQEGDRKSNGRIEVYSWHCYDPKAPKASIPEYKD